MAAAELLCHAHGVQTLLATPSLVSLPLVIQAGPEMLVLITVGNTNQKGTFFYSCLHLHFPFRVLPFSVLFLFGSVHARGGCSTSSVEEGPGQSLGMQQHRMAMLRGLGLLAVSSPSPVSPWVALPTSAHDGSPWLPDTGAPSCLPPCSKPSPCPWAPAPGVFPLLYAASSCPPWGHAGPPPTSVSQQPSVTKGTGCTVCILYHFSEGVHCLV